MKYYIGEIETYIGECMISTTIKFKTNNAPDKQLNKLVSDFWGDACTRDFDTELYDFGDKMAGIGRWQEVDADTFNKLSIIVELF
jgi:hypothetical protein